MELRKCRGPTLKLLSTLLSSLTLGCHAVGAAGTPAVEKPREWVLVTRPCDGVGAHLVADATAHYLEPVIEAHAVCSHVLRVTGHGRSHLHAGELAELDVRVDATVRESHVLEVRSSGMDVVLLTPSEFTLRPGVSAKIRLTAYKAVAADVLIRVRKCSRVE